MSPFPPWIPRRCYILFYFSGNVWFPAIVDEMGFLGDGAVYCGAFGYAAVVGVVGEGVGGGAVSCAEEAVFAVPGVGDSALADEVAVGVVDWGG